MIIIKKPYVESGNNNTLLKCEIHDSEKNKVHELWFSVDKKYEKYLTPEVSDAFLLIVFQIAMKSSQEIKSEGPISERLLYNLQNIIMPIVTKMYTDHSMVQIEAPTLNINFQGSGVGTGCSLGVDSFSTIIDGISEKLPKEHRLTHLALFNSGQHGDNDLVAAENQFHKDIKKLQAPASELGLPLIGINSNINTLYKEYDYPLLHRFVFSTIAFPLALQKLFKAYTFASSYPIDNFSLDPSDICHVEYVILSMLSTESTSIRNSNPTYTRVDKTELLCDSPIARQNLEVCWGHQIYSMYGHTAFIQSEKLNCGVCDKCMRTLFTLETLGKLQYFEEIFDIEAYKKYKNKYLVKVLANHKSNPFLAEIYSKMKEAGYPIPLQSKILAFGVKLGLYKLAQKLFGFTTMMHGKKSSN